MRQIDKKFILHTVLLGLVYCFLLVLVLFIFLLPAIDGEGKHDTPFLNYFLWFMLTYFCCVVLTWVIATLTRKFYKYELKKQVFYIEKGIIWKKYVSIPYNRIQNVDMSRGVLERALGLSTLYIQTAGSSHPHTALSEGRIPGLTKETAKALHDEIIKYTQNTPQDGGAV